MQFRTREAAGGGLFAALVVAFAPALATPAAVGGPDRLVGIWMAQGRNVPAISGRMDLERADGVWRAEARDFRATSVARDGRLTFAFSSQRGELRMETPTARGARGLWIQPGSLIDANQYTTPLRFSATARNHWTALLTPYVPRFQLYITIVQQPDGSLGGFIRDPVGNFGTMSDFTRITVDGRKFVLHRRNRNHDGLLDEDATHFRLSIGSGKPTIFRRIAPAQADGVYPRTAGGNAASDVPERTSDGWDVAAPAAEHIDTAVLGTLAGQLAIARATSARSPFIQSVLVARNGRLVFDEYYFGFTRKTPHDVRSAGKTLAAALFGIAERRNPRLNAQSPVVPWFAFGRILHPDPRKARIAAGDLLDMTSGLDCDDNNDESPGNEDTMQSQTAQPNWYEYTLDLPMVRDPGLPKAVYCSAGMNLVGGVIGPATRTWTPQLFEDAFARPLQFGEHHLQLTPNREMYLGGGSYFLPRDFLKLGQLFLDGGTWHGTRVVSTGWVKDATSPHSGLNAPNDYGYAWHLTTYRARGKTYHAFEAQGNGGQLLVVVPALKLVTQILAANYGDYQTWSTFRDLIGRYVVAACR